MTAVGPGPMVYDQTGLAETRHGNRSANNAPRNTYQTAEGSWVAVSASAQRIAERVLTLVGHPEIIDEPWFGTGRGRAEHADLLDALVGEWIGARSRAEVLAGFEAAGAAVAPVYSARTSWRIRTSGRRDADRGAGPGPGPAADVQRVVADVGHTRRDPAHRPAAGRRYRRGADRRARLRPREVGRLREAGVIR